MKEKLLTARNIAIQIQEAPTEARSVSGDGIADAPKTLYDLGRKHGAFLPRPPAATLTEMAREVHDLTFPLPRNK